MDSLQKLTEMARNLWWSWNPEALDLFKRLNPDVFQASGNNPIAALNARDESLLDDGQYARNVDEVYAAFSSYLKNESRFDQDRSTAYFCMEYGLHESVRLYAGGLGVLAGDHTKAASDLRLPFAAVGLFLRDGYFKQYFDSKGWQLSEYPSVDPTSHVFEPVLDATGDPVIVHVPIGHETVAVRAWKVQVGRVPLYLLDTDTEPNRFELRHITRRLYSGNRKTRIQQEIVLGIGGVRLLRALGHDPQIYHMNEGHCAFAALELLREKLNAGVDQDEAISWIRSRAVFTTHTPVWAGHDRFDPGLFMDQMHGFATEMGTSAGELLRFGRVNADDQAEAFTMTLLGLNFAAKCNGVSELNGQVARAQWAHKYPDVPVDEVPIKHVTNGIHLASWTAPRAIPFLDRHLPGWRDSRDAWKRVWGIPDASLWEYRRSLRSALIDFVNRRVATQSMAQAPNLDPDVLTIGFARRFATYKRAPLIFRDIERAARILADVDRPVQLIYAGKAHPADDDGKWFIQRIYEISRDSAFDGRVVFVEGYDMEIGRMLVSGTDVWLNNPRRPYEASGTSGQKVAAHGGMNLSILDGWWPEGYNGKNGWAIGDDASASYQDPEIQDPEDARLLYELLENEVVPTFYDRDADGYPVAWIQRMKEAMAHLPYQFSAHRMLEDYVEQFYYVDDDAVVTAA